MTAALPVLRIGRPDWVRVESVAGLLYYNAGIQFFTTDVETDVIPIWPWGTVQFVGEAGLAAVRYVFQFWDAAAKTVLLGTYSVDCPASGTCYTSLVAVSPFVTVRVTQAAPAFNNRYKMRLSLSELQIQQPPIRYDLSMLTFNGTIGAAVTVTQNATITWDGPVNVFVFSGAVSSDFDLFDTDIGGVTSYYYLTRAGAAGQFVLHLRLLPHLLTLSMKNNDAAAKSFKWSVIPSFD